MTDPSYTAIAILVDRSGSMQTIRSDAEGALRAYIADQQQQPGRCTLRLCQFDNAYDTVYPSTDIHQVPRYDLVPRGSTALLDSMGKLIVEFGEELAAMPEDQRPARVLVAFVTDGQENASKEWTREAVFDAIARQRDQYGWDFVFLAANQDAVQEGAKYGIGRDQTLSFAGTGEGVAVAGASLSNYTTTTRSGKRAAFTAEDRSKAESGTS